MRPQRLLSDTKFSSSLDNRQEASKALLRGLPATLPTIKKILFTSPHRLSAEVRFTFFGTMSFVLEGVPERRRRLLLPLLREFLMSVERETAHAAFMCGCSMGNDWFGSSEGRSQETVLTVLADCMLHASYAAGRKSAMHGMEEALNRCSVNQG